MKIFKTFNSPTTIFNKRKYSFLLLQKKKLFGKINKKYIKIEK